MTLYTNRHQSQYQAGTTARTHAQGCTWTTGANGADASTGGAIRRTPDQVLAKVPRADETDPRTPGWSLVDLGHAMASLGVAFRVESGSGWAGVVAAHHAGLYIALQGDSDRFGNATCSGKFDGDHCIGIHPQAGTRWRIDDPICKDARYESPAVLRAYAEKFWPTVRFGVFTHPVPLLLPDISEEPLLAFSIPQSPSIAEAVRDTKLYTRSDLTGTSYAVSAGATKRHIGSPAGDSTVVIIGHDRSPDVAGKSALYGRAADWKVQVSP